MLEIKRGKTHRGFDLLHFKDFYEQECSLQVSSICGPSCVWFGVDNTGLHIKGPKGGFNEEVYNRMHLSIEQIKVLIEELQFFVDNEHLKGE